DLVAIRQNRIYVIDTQIVTDGLSLDQAHQRKVGKYDTPDIRTNLRRFFGAFDIEFHSATANWRGIWSGQSVKRLIASDLLSSGDSNIISVRLPLLLMPPPLPSLPPLLLLLELLLMLLRQPPLVPPMPSRSDLPSRCAVLTVSSRMELTAFIQANCGRGRAATLELAVRLRESGCLFALLQEPYIGSGTSDVLPEGMQIYTDRRQKAAILVDHQDVICMPMEPLTTDYGVCVSVKGSFGSIFLCSAYCQFDTELEPYLRYMDAVLLQASRT
ncbi:hypothetical protein KR067_002595, partial [Drosophila pandora]